MTKKYNNFWSGSVSYYQNLLRRVQFSRKRGMDCWMEIEKVMSWCWKKIAGKMDKIKSAHYGMICLRCKAWSMRPSFLWLSQSNLNLLKTKEKAYWIQLKTSNRWSLRTSLTWKKMTFAPNNKPSTILNLFSTKLPKVSGSNQLHSSSILC